MPQLLKSLFIILRALLAWISVFSLLTLILLIVERVAVRGVLFVIGASLFLMTRAFALSLAI
jgi:hypothetical protein